MEASTFDALARSVTSVRSRRDLTRLLSGLVLSGPLAAMGVSDAFAKHKNHHHKKKKPRPTCSSLGGEVACAVNVSNCADFFPCSDPGGGPCCDTILGNSCTSCGCCAEGRPQCCIGFEQGEANNMCCPADATCCWSTAGDRGECCPPGVPCIDGSCIPCPPGRSACHDLEGPGYKCCSDGSDVCCNGECCPPASSKCCPGIRGCVMPEVDCSRLT